MPCRSKIESLESRRLLATTTVIGQIFADFDGDKSFDYQAPDAYRTGWTAYLDQNDNDQADPGEPVATMGTSFQLPNVPQEQTGLVKAILPEGWEVTTRGFLYDAVEHSGADVLRIGVRPVSDGGLVGGRVLNVSAHQRPRNQLGKAGMQVILDQNANGAFDAGEQSVITDADGVFYFANLPAGEARVQLINGDGWWQDDPVNRAPFVVNVTSQTRTGAGLFMVRNESPTGRAGIQYFLDDDGDGVQDAGELIDPNTTWFDTYWDMNQNGVFDQGEPLGWAGSGSYGKITLPVGSGYHLRGRLPDYYYLTTPGLVVADVEAGDDKAHGLVGVREANNVYGQVFEDDYLAGGFSEPGRGYEGGASGRTVYLDANNNGVLDTGEARTTTDSGGNFKFLSLADGTYTIKQVVPSGKFQTYPIDGGHVVTLVGGRNKLHIGFGTANTSASTGARIRGVAYVDLNENGFRDSDEPTLPGNRVFDDRNGNGQLDIESESFGFTDPLGRFELRNVASGTAMLHNEAWGNPLLRVPVQVGSGSLVDNFALASPVSPRGAFSGRVFVDLNQDGIQQPSEPGAADFEVAQLNAVWRTAVDYQITDELGNFAFYQWLNDDSYGLHVYLPRDYYVTNPEVLQNDFAPDGSIIELPPIGVYNPGLVGGGVLGRVTDQPVDQQVAAVSLMRLAALSVTAPIYGVPVRTVWADLNNNGRIDNSEPTAVTDVDGNYSFRNLRSGTYRFRQLLPAGWVQTFPLNDAPVVATVVDGEYVFGQQFGTAYVGNQSGKSASISGRTFNDNNANGVYDAGDSPTSRTVFLDTDNDGNLDSGETSLTSNGDGTFTFSNLPAGTYHVRRVFPPGWVASNPARDYVVAGGQTITGADIGSVKSGTVVTPPDTNPPPSDPMDASIAGVTYNDNNANGIFDAGDLLITGKTVFLDANNNGKLDSGEKSTTSNGSGAFSFTGLAAGAYSVRRVFPSGFTYSNLPINLTLAQSQALVGANIGSVPNGTVVTPPDTNPPPPPPAQYGSISGVLYNDNNANGVFDAGDSPISRVVFLDANNNGKLDSGETSVTSASDGTFTFANLGVGTYHVRRAFPGGYKASNPVRDYTLAAGQVITGADIGSVASSVVVTPPGENPPPPPNNDTGSISGFLFWDADRDGVFDSSEDYQGGKTVFIDLDDDNVLDANERRLTTDSQGRFNFDGLTAGTYIVKRVVPKGYAITTPKQTVTLGAGQIFSGVAIGTNTN